VSADASDAAAARGRRGRRARIGLTGPIGCGKSTVAGWLAELGAVVISADQVSRDVVEPGESALAAVLARFGAEFRAADGGLDRAALGRLVFGSPSDLADLEAIVLPAIRARVRSLIAAADESGALAVVVEAIRLVEGGLVALCDEVWLVVCSPPEQRERLRARGMADDEAERRIAVQGDVAGRVRPVATLVLDSSGPAAAFRVRLAAEFGRVVAR